MGVAGVGALATGERHEDEEATHHGMVAAKGAGVHPRVCDLERGGSARGERVWAPAGSGDFL